MDHCKAHFQTTDKVLEAIGKTRADLPPDGQVASAVKSGTFRRGAEKKGVQAEQNEG